MGGLISASVSTAQWSKTKDRPTLRDDSIKPGSLVIKMSKMFFFVSVGFFLYLGQGMIMQARQKMFALPLVGG